ncbi:hypothetical protein Tco_0905039, partial [Tanacetum coccineum]
FEDELEMRDEVHKVVHDNLVRANSKYKQDDIKSDDRTNFVYPYGNDAGPSIEERAFLFLESTSDQEHEEERAGEAGWEIDGSKGVSIVGVRKATRNIVLTKSVEYSSPQKINFY